jgi:hypothetical protein
MATDVKYDIIASDNIKMVDVVKHENLASDKIKR